MFAVNSRWLLASCMLLLGPAASAADSFPDVVKDIKKSIVAIGTVQRTRNPPQIFSGTGFVVGDGTKIITNKHVIGKKKLDFKNHEYLAVFYGEGKKAVAIPVDLIRQDPIHDLALLELPSNKKLPALKLAKPGLAREGETIAFTGFPLGMLLGLYPVTHQGMVSSITPIAIPPVDTKKLTPDLIRALRDPYKVMQLDATAYPGNSGSPVYDKQTREVIGVINAVFVKGKKESAITNPTGITYAIPVKYVHELLNR